jgi:hypothetical protein
VYFQMKGVWRWVRLLELVDVILLKLFVGGYDEIFSLLAMLLRVNWKPLFLLVSSG